MTGKWCLDLGGQGVEKTPQRLMFGQFEVGTCVQVKVSQSEANFSDRSDILERAIVVRDLRDTRTRERARWGPDNDEAGTCIVNGGERRSPTMQRGQLETRNVPCELDQTSGFDGPAQTT